MSDTDQDFDPLGRKTSDNVRQYRTDVLARIINEAGRHGLQVIVLDRELRAVEWWERRRFLYVNRTRDTTYATPSRDALKWNAARLAAFADAFQAKTEGWAVHKKDWHFHRRLFERYGVVLKHEEFDRITTEAMNGRRLWEKVSHSERSICALRLRRALVYVVINEAGKLITALTPGEHKARAQGEWKVRT